MADPKPLEGPLSGTILPGRGAPVSVQDLGDFNLAKFRGTLFRSWTRGDDIRDVRAALRPLADLITQAVADLDRADRRSKRTSLRIRDAQQINRLAINATNEVFESLESTIEVAVGKAIKRAQRGQIQHLRKIGIRVPSVQVRRDIRNEVLGMLDEEFPPGSGKTFRTRLAALQRSRQIQLRSILRQSKQEGSVYTAIQRDIKNALMHSKPGSQTPVRGGSAFKQIRRMLVAEETRIANVVEIRTLDAAGVQFAYWRLNPSHRWYGGGEICEHLASSTGNGVNSALSELETPTGRVDTNGLYLLGGYPDYPHPYCRCYPEAWAP